MGTRCTTQVQKKRSGAGRSSGAAVSAAAPAARPDASATAAVAAPRQRERGKEAPWQLAEMIEGQRSGGSGRHFKP